MSSNTDTRNMVDLLSSSVDALGADEEAIQDAIHSKIGSNTDAKAIIGLLTLLNELLESGGGGGGGTGESTIAWKPKVDEDGNLTWTRTISSSTPAPQNIKGKDGVGITSVDKDESNHLIVTYSDGTKKDVGELAGDAKLSEAITATVNIGSVKYGKTYAKGTSFEAIIRDILINVEKPVVKLSLVPATTVYDVVSDKITAITLKGAVTKKTYNLKSISFYDGTTLVHTQSISAEGTYSKDYVPTTPINKDTTFKAVVEDIEGNTTESSVKVSFVGKTYYGVVDPDTGVPTDAQIKALNTTLKTTKGYVYKGITCDFNKVVYAYPTDFGALTSIKDVDNNINYTNSFTKTNTTIDGIPYYVYTLTEPTGADGVNITFA